MRYDPDLIEIEHMLAELYRDVAEAKRIIDYAGLPAHRISWEGKAIDIWHGILSEAYITREVHNLISTCIRESDSEELRVAYQRYLSIKQNALPPENSTQAASRHAMNTVSSTAYAECVECKITFCEDISFATHEYHYSLRNFGYAEGENTFYFIVPNAEPHQVKNEVAFEGDNPIKISKKPYSHSTTLVLENLAPLTDGNAKTLRFSYDAPTSRLMHHGLFVSTGYYHAELIHEFEITKSEKVIINFPKGTRIKSSIDMPARIEGTTASFEAYNISRGEMRKFSVFFRLYRKRQILLAAVGLAVLFLALTTLSAYLLCLTP